MTRAEKILYHQIHPLKLLTDVTSSFASCWLLWEARWVEAAIVAFVPSIVVTGLLLWRVDLERYKNTPFGRYVGRFMSHRIEGVRSAGQIVMWIGSALHIPWLLPVGFLIVIYGWANGLWAYAPE